MATIIGRVRSIAINDRKLSFMLDEDGSGPAVRLVLYEDAPNTALVSQMEMATRSWMLSLLQTAFNSGKPLTAHFDDKKVVSQIEISQSHISVPDVPVGTSHVPKSGG